MKSFLAQVAAAACFPSLIAAAYKDAFVVEFDDFVQWSSESLHSQVQASLAARGFDCTASSRFFFNHAVFRGGSFNLDCTTNKLTRQLVVSTVQAIDGVEKAWPVTNVEPAIYRGNLPGARDGSSRIARDLGSYVGHDTPKPLAARDGADSDTFSTHVDTGVAKLRTVNITGDGVKIAVIDSGFDVDVAGLSKTNIAYVHDLTDNDNDVRDNCSFHGTHVFGIIGAKGDEARYGVSGVAPDAAFELYRVAPCGESSTNDMLINSFLEAAERGANIISCSFGGGKAFPEDPWSAVATRLFRNGTYVSLPSGNGGPGIFSGVSPAMSDAVTSVGSTDNTVTPYLTWQGNWTATTGGGPIRFIPGLPFDLPANNKLTIWSPNEVIDQSTECQPVPEAKDLPADLSNVLLLSDIAQCWNDAAGASVSLTKTLGIPYAIYYTSKTWTVSDGPGFFEDTLDPDVKAVATVDYETGRQLLDAFHKDRTASVYLANDFSVANPTLENRPNNRTGLLASNFSAWGPALTGRSMPLFLAPGGNLLSTFPAKYGGYGVVGGTSQSVPFEAGVAALVKQAHPDYTPEEIQAVIAATARPVKWYDASGKVSDFLAPVFQQGGGLLDAWNAVHSTTLLNVGELSFNDTVNRPKSLSFDMKNTGKAAINYKLSHRGAASGYVLQTAKGFNFTRGEAFPVYADVTITPASIKIEPGQSASISVAVAKEPALPEAAERVSYFGGYIAIDAEGSPDVNSFTLPYTGFGAPLATIPIVDRDNSYLMYWNMTSSSQTRIEPGRVFKCTLDLTKDMPASFPDNLYPGVWLDPVIQSRHISIILVDAKSGKEVITPDETSSDQVWGGPNTWYWDGSDANKTFIPAGSYSWRVKAQRLHADPAEDSSWDVFDTGTWVLEYMSNSTLPANSTM
ncbi:Minor extracellular protease vpr [Colletotrichum trifolii]|uniref:Minor extracellular protease vpr n=1 Tax=Colletotrichum trifolii TaxID=5466 RepID=A0A4R8QPV8_COLTR|nr:Minor extracellular protease vpr [Colletotrichum trifolii]